MNTFIEANGEIYFIHRLSSYAKEGNLEAVRQLYYHQLGILADAAQGAVEGNQIEILLFCQKVGFTFRQDFLTTVKSRVGTCLDISDGLKKFFKEHSVDLPEETENNLEEEKEIPPESQHEIYCHEEHLKMGLSIGQSRDRLRRQAEFHREKWIPNIDLYKNDKNISLENAFDALISVHDQIQASHMINSHIGIPFDEISLEGLQKQLHEMKTTIEKVESLKKFKEYHPK